MLAIVSFTCAFSITELSAQKQVELNKIVIIEKEVDENGNITEVKKVLEGAEAKAYMNRMKEEEGTETITMDDSSTRKKIRVVREDGGEAEEMEFEWDGDEIPEEVKKLMEEQGLDLEELSEGGKKKVKVMRSSDKEMEVEVEATAGGSQKVKIITKDGNEVEQKEFDWEGDEVPAEVKELLEKEGLNLEQLEGSGGMKRIKVERKDNKDGAAIKRPKRAQLGVNIEDHPQGVYVSNVMPESSAMVAGLKKGDVITAVDGVKVTTMIELVNQIKGRKVGDELKVEYNRSGNSLQADVLLKEAIDPSALRDKSWRQKMNGKEASFKIVFHESLKK